MKEQQFISILVSPLLFVVIIFWIIHKIIISKKENEIALSNDFDELGVFNEII